MRRTGDRQRTIAQISGGGGTCRAVFFFAVAASVTFRSASARAQTTSPPSPLPEAEGAAASTPLPAPPPLDIPYVQFGVAFTTEAVTDAGRMCASSAQGVPCILGSGGGVVARLGRRSAGPWYFGGAYELSKQDPSNLYRFATLQQLRAEARWYLDTGRDIYPYATAASGVAAYGDEWKIDTYGPVESLGIGGEAQVSRRTVVGLAVSYRFLVLNDYFTSTGYQSGASIVQMIGVDLFVEERSPIVSALTHQ
jgi:hypothetical protein